MLRIETLAETDSDVTFALLGRVTAEHLPEVARLLAEARARRKKDPRVRQV